MDCIGCMDCMDCMDCIGCIPLMLPMPLICGTSTPFPFM